MTLHKFIGGFFEMALPNAHVRKSIAEHWQLPDDPALRFVNARSALAALISVIQSSRIWLPAYVCDSVVESVNASGKAINFFSVGDSLEPDVITLDQNTQPGDVVLAINYFGRPPNKNFLNFVRKRKDLLFIEDCAQTIDSQAWGNWRLISPRKIIGVADGGYIISTQTSKKYQLTPSIPRNDINHWTAPLLRFEDKDKIDNLRWHLANQQREKSMTVSDARMSYLSHQLLKLIDAPSIIMQRKNNFKILHEQLSHIAFISTATPDFCPFGFPIRLASKNLRTHVHDELIKINLFPTIHWQSLPSPAQQFQKEHHLAQELLTLPCDQRYDTSEMQYLAQSVLKILKQST